MRQFVTPATTVVLAVAACIAHAQVAPPPAAPAGAAPPQRPAAGQPAPPPGDNIIVQAAQRANLQTCMPQLKSVSDFLIAGAPHGAFVTQHARQPDRQLFSAIIERVDQMGSHVITLNLSPAPMGGCAIEYSQVTSWSEPCQKVAGGAFAGYKVKGGLVKNVSVLEREPLLHTFLMPTGTGCVSVKREVLYFSS